MTPDIHPCVRRQTIADALRRTPHMANFKAPKRVIFADSLPKNPSGKRLKRQLRQSYKI